MATTHIEDKGKLGDKENSNKEKTKFYKFLKSEIGVYHHNGQAYNEEEYKKIIVENDLTFEFTEYTMNYEQHLIEVFAP
jgi:intein-encoded DNA endonuclease-like protein